MSKFFNTSLKSKIAAILSVLLVLITATAYSDMTYAATNLGSATGYVASSNGAILRAEPSTSSDKVTGLDDNDKLYIKKEVFTSKNKTDADTVWYYVYTSGKKGYIRSDLVDNITYQKNQAKVLASLTTRVGPATTMKSGVSVKKNAKINVLLRASVAGSKDTWYKFKSGSRYYYIRGNRVKHIPKTTTITVTDVNKPVEIPEGLGFNLEGSVASNKDIEKVEVDILDSKGKKAIKATASPDVTYYNLSGLDSKVPFGDLKPGKYTFVVKITIDGKTYTKYNAAFKIKKCTAPEKIVNTAWKLAWPAGTGSSKYAYHGGSATSDFKTAINKVYPNRSGWGAAPKVGASCDVFVGTTIRTSGYDKDFPRGLSGQWKHLESSSKWKEVKNFDGTAKNLKNGDVIIYTRSNGGHIFIFFDQGGKVGYAEAAYQKAYGHIVSGYSAANKKVGKSSIKKIKVFRATS